MKKFLLIFVMVFAHSFIAQNKATGSEEFNSFFKKFNADKSFQMSRIKFPLTVKLNNDDYELVDYSIAKSDYIILNLNKSKEVRDYTQKTILKSNSVIIEQRGINNGIYVDYIFEKRKGLWFLKTWIDSST